METHFFRSGYFELIPLAAPPINRALSFTPDPAVAQRAYFLRNFLKDYYQHKLAVQEDRLHELKRNKRKLLNEIMEKETYKVAKELIEKYDPQMLREHSPRDLDLSVRLNQSMNSSILRHRGARPMNPMNQTAMASLSLEKKTLPRQSPMMMGSPMPRPAAQPPAILPPNQLANPPLNPTPLNPQQLNLSLMRPPALVQPARRPNLVRPISSQDRSIVEKLVDYMVGDGPNNRYALICKFCYSHNGMAHKDEFDYLNFRCCFCNNFNPARKQKPLAPTLVSFENAKDSLTDEALTENLKKFQIEDSSETSKNLSQSSSQIEELENKLSEAKLDEDEQLEEASKSAETGANDEMQVDDDSNKADVSNEDTPRTSAMKEQTWRIEEFDFADS